MRVLLSTDTVGGVWDYAATLARGLDDAGHRVLLAVLGRPDEGRLRSLPPAVEVEWRDSLLEWMPGASGDLGPAGEWLAATSRRWDADLAHLNQMAYAVHDFGAPALVAVHSDVLSWFAETLGQPAPPEWGEYARRVRAGLAAADAVVTVSAWQSALTRRHYGRAADRVIHNGARPPAGEPPPRREPLVLSAGRAWDAAKGMAILDRALALLADRAPPARLLGEPEGPHGQRFRAERLILHGHADRAELDRWMRRATVYVGASLYEPFGLAPLEAALHGCALVLSDLPSFRELWDGCAVFFPRGDPRALADALDALGDDPGRRGALAAAARARALERYTEERCTAEYLELYHRILAGTPSPPGPLSRSRERGPGGEGLLGTRHSELPCA